MPVNVRFDNAAAARFGAKLFNAGQQTSIQTAADSALTAVTKAKQSPDNTKIALWFGALTPALQLQLNQGVDNMYKALTNRPITFSDGRAATPSIVVGGGAAPVAMPWTGADVFGYVHSAGSHTGTGMRIVLGTYFFSQAYKERTQTILHELSHKVLGTSDVNWPPHGTCYGVNLAQDLAANFPDFALTNAENWGYYLSNYVHTWP